jgi:Amt family ammonium transporter
MSHELRTPMNAVLGFAEMLQDQASGGLNPRQAKYVANVLTGGRHLLQLINDVLDLSKVEAGHMDLAYQILDVSETLRGVHAIAKALAMKKGLEFPFQIPDGLPPLAADGARVKQILYNLLSNAIKFTPEGGTVRLAAHDRGDALEVVVSDTGIGLEDHDLQRIFQVFEQVDSSYARRQQGTGLGLSLTRQLVEMHGGRVWAESQGLGHGSTFRVTLPWRPAGAAGLLTPSAADGSDGSMERAA